MVRAAYTFRVMGRSNRTHYVGLLLDGDGEPVWACPHRHPAGARSPRPGPVEGSTVLTSALDCARFELARRAEEAMPVA